MNISLSIPTPNIIEDKNIQIMNNFKLLYNNFLEHKTNSDIFIITSWVKHSNGKFKPFPNTNFKASKYNFSVKVILNELVLGDKNLSLRVKVISIIDSEISTIKPNDYLVIKINNNVLQTPMSYITNVFTSCFDISNVKNNTIKLFNYAEAWDVDNINYLSFNQDDETDPNYFDLEELTEQVNLKMKKDYEQLEIIKNWIFERKDIYEIVKELKKYIRELENY